MFDFILLPDCSGQDFQYYLDRSHQNWYPFPDLRGKSSSLSPIKNDVSCGLSVSGLCYVELSGECWPRRIIICLSVTFWIYST